MKAALSRLTSRTSILLLLAVAVGAFLRFYRLDAQQVWGDEAMSICIAQLPLREVLTPRLDTHPPLFYLALYVWTRLFGTGLFALRALSAAFSLPAIPLAFGIGDSLIGRRAGLIAAWLMALSPLEIYYAQELRMYAAVAVLGIASTYFFLRMFRSESAGAGARVGYALTTLAAMYTHYQALLLLGVQAIAALILWRKPRRRFFAWLGIVGALAVAYIPWVWAQTAFLREHSPGLGYSLAPARLATITADGFQSYVTGHTAPPAIASAGLALALLIGVVGAFRLRRSREALIFLGLWLALVPLLWWLADPLMPFFHPRFIIVGAPALLLLVAAGLDFAASRWALAGAAGALLVAGIFAASLQNWYFDPAYAKGEYGSGISEIVARAEPGDLILLHNAEQQCLFDYYRPAGVPAATLTSDDTITPERAAEALSRATEGYARAWLLTYGSLDVFDPQRNAESWLSAHGYRAYYKSFKGFYLSLYVLGSPPSAPTQRLDARFEDGVRLAGYDARPQPAHPGATLLLTLYWQADATPTANYVVFAQLLDSAGALVAQMDGEPAGGARPTLTWKPGETILDSRAIALKDSLAPGEYTLQVGLYTWPDLTRLRLADGSGADALLLTEVTVE